MTLTRARCNLKLLALAKFTRPVTRPARCTVTGLEPAGLEEQSQVHVTDGEPGKAPGQTVGAKQLVVSPQPARDKRGAACCVFAERIYVYRNTDRVILDFFSQVTTMS